MKYVSPARYLSLTVMVTHPPACEHAESQQISPVRVRDGELWGRQGVSFENVGLINPLCAHYPDLELALKGLMSAGCLESG